MITLTTAQKNKRDVSKAMIQAMRKIYLIQQGRPDIWYWVMNGYEFSNWKKKFLKSMAASYRSLIPISPKQYEKCEQIIVYFPEIEKSLNKTIESILDGAEHPYPPSFNLAEVTIQ